ncbi:MAG: hypothetical protein QXD77_00705 [Candidatus Aenigmatarchaeota archaeon]
MAELPLFGFVPDVKTAELSDWKGWGVPATKAGSPYLGYYVCVGPVDPVSVEQGSNQQIEINYTGAPGTASGLYYALTFQLLKWQYNVVKVDEWIEVSPTHREYFERTLASKSALEGTIKEGLRSAAQAVADYELVKHDLRKYREIMDYLTAVEVAKKEKDAKKRHTKLLSAEHALKSMYVDQVDVHTGAMSLVEMARSRWPTVIADFYSLTEEDDTVDGIKDRLKISRAEAVVLKTKNTLFREWLKLFGGTVKDRYETLQSLVMAREKSIKEYQEWIKPYISRYKALKVGHERPELRKSALTSFADLTGQATFANVITIWAFKPYRAVEYKKMPHVVQGKFTIDPYDSWAKLFIKDPKRGLASRYPWLLNKGSKEGNDVADDIVEKLKAEWSSGKIFGLDPKELYYIFFEIVVTRLGLRLQVGELEDITFMIKTWVLSQNIMLVKLVEKECREREVERYIEEMLGLKKGEKPAAELVKAEFADLMGTKVEKKEPGEMEKLASELRGAIAEITKVGGALGKAVSKESGRFVKPGPYETDFSERITKQYLIPSGRMLGSLTNLLFTKMGVG